jgi:hypothetical protein
VVIGFIERRASGKLPLVVDKDEAADVSTDSEWKLAASPEGFSDRPMPPGFGATSNRKSLPPAPRSLPPNAPARRAAS